MYSRKMSRLKKSIFTPSVFRGKVVKDLLFSCSAKCDCKVNVALYTQMKGPKNDVSPTLIVKSRLLKQDLRLFSSCKYSYDVIILFDI